MDIVESVQYGDYLLCLIGRFLWNFWFLSHTLELLCGEPCWMYSVVRLVQRHYQDQSVHVDPGAMFPLSQSALFTVWVHHVCVEFSDAALTLSANQCRHVTHFTHSCRSRIYSFMYIMHFTCTKTKLMCCTPMTRSPHLKEEYHVCSNSMHVEVQCVFSPSRRGWWSRTVFVLFCFFPPANQLPAVYSERR